MLIGTISIFLKINTTAIAIMEESNLGIVLIKKIERIESKPTNIQSTLKPRVIDERNIRRNKVLSDCGRKNAYEQPTVRAMGTYLSFVRILRRATNQ